MPDPADLAAESIEQEEAIRERQRKAMMANKSVSEECVDCDEPISQERQEATGGTDRCVHCQGIHDDRTKRMR